MQVSECPLTGLPNRRGLIEHLDHSLNQDRANHDAFAVIFCDLNRFQEVNNVHGHDAGDALLVEISRRLRDATGPGDLVSRLGVDEFVVVSHNLDRISQAQTIANRLRQAVGAAWAIGPEVLHPSLSIGIAIASSTTDPLSAQDLIRRADQARDTAKRAHRLGAQLSEVSIARKEDSSTPILQALHHAIAHRTLEFHYQPIVALNSGTLHGHEVLVRLPGLDGELLSPDRFIGHAERNRLIGQLGHQVLEQALAQWSRREPGAQQLSIAVNVSPLELDEPGYATRVLDICANAGVDPARLQLEITETAVIAHPTRTAAVLHQLRQAGVQIHLDDFGTGYSSLSLLTELPVDGLKIDRSFTAALGTDPSRTAVIQAITHLSRQLGLSLIAEGIETEAQQQQLIALGCDQGQGYLFGRPQPLAQGSAISGYGSLARSRCQPLPCSVLTGKPASRIDQSAVGTRTSGCASALLDRALR